MVKAEGVGEAAMSRKGKSRTRIARRNLLRGNAKIAARKSMPQAAMKGYDKRGYDGHQSEEAGGST